MYLWQECCVNVVTEIRHKRRITVAAASKILANLTYAYKGMGLSMGTMLAGVRFDLFSGKWDEV